MAGIRLGPGPGLVLYTLLLGAAGLAFFGKEFPGRLPDAVQRVTPFVFGAFVALFAAYRFVLVRSRKYPSFKAFYQVGLAVVVFLLLLPSARASYSPSPRPGLAADLQDSNARVRTLAAEVARNRPEAARYAPALVTASASANKMPHSDTARGTRNAQAVKSGATTFNFIRREARTPTSFATRAAICFTHSFLGRNARPVRNTVY